MVLFLRSEKITASTSCLCIFALFSDSTIDTPPPPPLCRALSSLFWSCLPGQSLGLSEFSEVLASPPPGIDELVALSRVLKLARSEE